MSKTCIFSLSFESLEQTLLQWQQSKYRAKQIWDFVYTKFVFDFNEMSALPKDLRTKLNENFFFSDAHLVADKKSKKDAGKFLFSLADGFFVESVLLTAPDYESGDLRKTLCISTQVGCAQSCKFCASTLNGFKRNLSLAEIMGQFIAFSEPNKGFDFENIVVMGMGEPLANMQNILAALKVVHENFKFGARRITLSTCGLADKIKILAENGFPYRLAVSLHGATNEVRNQIMPVNKKFPLEELLPALKMYSTICKRMPSLEYILIDKVNDSFKDAEHLAQIAKDLHAHINLIPYNTVEALSWKRPSMQRCNAFLETLKKRKVSATLRREKGSDIEAACGQLALKAQEQK